jgi:hypothetical protein
MKIKAFLYLLLGGALAYSCQPSTDDTTTSTDAVPAMSAQDSIKRGEYLTYMSGCQDCHSPKIFTAEGRMLFDSTRLMSGHPASEALPAITDRGMLAPGQWLLFNGGITAYVGPWGTSYAANLTPHASGIGEWSFEQFKNVLTKGKFKGMDNGRPIMPPMPWENFRHMEDADMRAIWAYLRSLPPIDNVVPAYTPPTQG